MRRILLAIASALFGVLPAMAQESTPPLAAGSFRITFIAARQPEPYSGRVYIVLGGPGREPRQQMGRWSAGPQVFSKDVKDIPSGGSADVGPESLGFPRTFADASEDEFYVQAVARRSPDSPNAGKGPGDLYSKPQRVRFARSEPGVLELKLTEVVEEQPFVETDRVKLVDINSPCLSAFYGREVRSRASVILPEGWEDSPNRRYPTIYFIGGFGGTHREGRFMQRMIPADHAKDVLLVVPTPAVPWATASSPIRPTTARAAGRSSKS